MKITIILNQPYPYGMACTNRIHLYAKRFRERGNDVEIIVPKPTESHRTPVRNTERTGVYDGIKFWYPVKPARSNSFFKRRIDDVFAYFKTLSYILSKRRNSDILLLVDTRFYMGLTYKLFCVFFGCKLVAEKSELPFVFAKKTPLTKLFHRFYENYFFRWYDGVIVISNSLFKYFSERVGKKTKLIIVPILTDSSVFKPTSNNSGEIVYAGVLNQFKDGIFDLLQAYHDFKEETPGKKLVLMGDINLSPDKNEVNRFIDENNLQQDVEITGYVSRQAMIDRLTNAAVLVLAKPANQQAEHCIPTKLAEYLSTGKPVLTTKTGSIPMFLTDQKDAYLAEPNNPDQLADKLRTIFSNYEEAEVIGANGRSVALEQFEYSGQGDRIISFFEQMIEK
ncbi:MAG TPA: glycosyltransferase [Mucilaginibacter sp.]|nr:glycosyltransferase [Mucilaginibacter sp.]